MVDWGSFAIGAISAAVTIIIGGFLKAAGSDLYQFVKCKIGGPGITKADLVEFIEEGQRLRRRADENPLPVENRNDWVETMNAHFSERGASDLATRLSDFTGLTFYGDVSERSGYLKSIDGRITRLHEFLKETD